MSRKSRFACVLLCTLTLACAAAPPAVAASPEAPLPALFAPVPSGDGAVAPLSFLLPNGARFMDVDWDCVNICQEEYLECSRGCSACDQCSCQLAYCNASCGIPFQGC